MSDVHNGTEQKTNCVAWFAGRIDGLDAAIAIADQLMDRGTSTGEAIAEVRNRIERMRLSTKADHARLGAK
ncbi:MAG: hypothetical protein SGI99_05740 [Pseudomonadota bacterium]|nr:hypothetical protein [Pseudomonadota bacterium]